MKTIWKHIDKAGVLHMTADIDEAEQGMKESGYIRGELLHE